MLSIREVYELFDEVGCCTFATLDGNGGVDSRIAHFFAYDDNGLYLRTMTGKPFYRQMVEGASSRSAESAATNAGTAMQLALREP